MTTDAAASMLPDKPPSRVRHSWRCTRTGPTVEVVRTDATGRARVVDQCQSCGGDDLADRVRTDTRPGETIDG